MRGANLRGQPGVAPRSRGSGACSSHHVTVASHGVGFPRDVILRQCCFCFSVAMHSHSPGLCWSPFSHRGHWNGLIG